MNNDTIGVDVSKDHLDAHRLADGATRRFANTKGGHKALIKWVAETPLYRVVFEPTGLYHRAVERALGIAGVPFVKVNPRQARRFAEATGKLAKTDRLDAAILARMGALLELEARPARSELFNPDMKAKYAHLIETGKPAKVALTAIMRKLVVLANALLKANRPWTPKIA